MVRGRLRDTGEGARAVPLRPQVPGKRSRNEDKRVGLVFLLKILRIFRNKLLTLKNCAEFEAVMLVAREA